MPPTRNIFAGKSKPIKALNDYVIQHAISIVIVTIVTNRCVLRYTKRITAVATAKDTAHRVDSSEDPNWGAIAEAGKRQSETESDGRRTLKKNIALNLVSTRGCPGLNANCTKGENDEK